MISRSVTLAIVDSQAILQDGISARRTVFAVTNPIGVTSKLFVVQNIQKGDEQVIEFRTFATASDIANLTEDQPPDEYPDRPYRVGQIALTTDNPEMVNEFIDTARRRFTNLLEQLKLLEITTTTQFTITY